MEIWERIEARLISVLWSKPKTPARLASYDSAGEADAWGALCRNAAAAERDESSPPKVRRMRRPSPSAPYVSAEVKDEHDYVFKEREGIHLDAGLVPRCSSKEINPHCCAHHAALSEVGCLEFFDYASPLPYTRGLVCASTPEADLGLCSRCESVGHLDEACPFGISDVDVMNVARLRREHRLSAGGRRRKVV
jgi:hypothetical protein